MPSGIVPQLPPMCSLPSTLEEALQPSDESRIITEPNEPYRIVHVNERWCFVCGYNAEESLGQTSRILQGLGTCQATLGLLQEALMQKRSLTVQLLNYTKSGRPFMNTLQVKPLFSSQGLVTHYLGVVLARFLDGGTAHPSSVRTSPPRQLPFIQMTQPGRESHDSGDSYVDPCLSGDFSSMHDLLEEEDDVPPPFMGSSSCGSASGSGLGRVPPFLTKLSEILSTEPETIVALDPQTSSFSILDANKFAKEVLPRFFKHNKLGSFSQQLHTYGFRRKAPSTSHEQVIRFCHDRYDGDPAHFLDWIRSGSASSKRTAHARDAPEEAGVPATEVMQGLRHIQDGTSELAFLFQQAKATHAIQLRTILMKLMVRGILSPESLNYISALPPRMPIMPLALSSEELGLMPAGPPMDFQSQNVAGYRSISVDGLQAHFDALESGISPLTSTMFPTHQAAASSMSSSIDSQGDDAMQHFAEAAGSMRESHGANVNERQTRARHDRTHWSWTNQ